MIDLTMGEFIRLGGLDCVDKLLAGTITHTGHHEVPSGSKR